MNKNDFINHLAKEMNTTPNEAEKSFTAVIKSLTHLLMQDEELTIPGFGKFTVIHKSARTGRNPINGKPLEIKAKAVPAFKPGDSLKLHVGNAVKANPKTPTTK